MIRCYLDPNIPEDSQCSKCCIYCDKQKNCEYLCEAIRTEWPMEKIAEECTFAYEDGEDAVDPAEIDDIRKCKERS